MTVATTNSSFSGPTWFCTASISSYRFVVTVVDLCVGFNRGFSIVFIVLLLCLLRLFCAGLFWMHNVNPLAAQLCETHYTFSVNCLTESNTRHKTTRLRAESPIRFAALNAIFHSPS